MTTLTLKINERTKAGKAFIAMSETFLSGVDGIEIIENTIKKIQPETRYNKDFIAKVKRAEENIKKRKTTQLNPKDIWASIL